MEAQNNGCEAHLTVGTQRSHNLLLAHIGGKVASTMPPSHPKHLRLFTPDGGCSDDVVLAGLLVLWHIMSPADIPEAPWASDMRETQSGRFTSARPARIAPLSPGSLQTSSHLLNP